jgi:hypothetical protein
MSVRMKVTGTLLAVGMVVGAYTLYSSDEVRWASERDRREIRWVWFTASWAPETQATVVYGVRHEESREVLRDTGFQRKETVRAGDSLIIRVTVPIQPNTLACWITVNDTVYASTDADQVQPTNRTCVVRAVAH